MWNDGQSAQRKKSFGSPIQTRKRVKQAGNRHANTQPSHLRIEACGAIENAISIEMKEPRLSCLSNFAVFQWFGEFEKKKLKMKQQRTSHTGMWLNKQSTQRWDEDRN